MISLAIVGCGGMGHRHLYGLGELARAGRRPFGLVGVCDPNGENAASLARAAAEQLGGADAPVVARDLEELAARVPELQAVDICADPRHHHTLAADALGRGWHVMVEKPMGLTVRACHVIREAAASVGRWVAVAENYRRDPINRLARALLDAGAIGAPRLALHTSIGGSNRILISTWRHQKLASGVLLDVGVHYADMLEYLLGEVESVTAQTRLHEPVRVSTGTEGQNTSSFYARWPLPPQTTCTAEDAAYALLTFRSGAVCQYIEDHAGHGRSLWQRSIFGGRGSLEIPNDRTGQPLRLTLDDGKALDDARVLDLVPEFRLDEITAALFGGDRLWRYDFPFVETDRKIIAIEYHDFADAIDRNRAPEVGPEAGTRACALSYALLESGHAGHPVPVEEVLTGRIDAYQSEIDESLFCSRPPTS
jgi:predicted dehydrogenase